MLCCCVFHGSFLHVALRPWVWLPTTLFLTHARGAGHHSTSDDSSAYRDMSDLDYWRTEASPINRFRKFMEASGWWDDEQEKALHSSERKAVLQAMLEAEKKPKPANEELFTDVYDEMLPSMKEQEAALKEHLAKYEDYYAKAH